MTRSQIMTTFGISGTVFDTHVAPQLPAPIAEAKFGRGVVRFWADTLDYAAIVEQAKKNRDAAVERRRAIFAGENGRALRDKAASSLRTKVAARKGEYEKSLEARVQALEKQLLQVAQALPWLNINGTRQAQTTTSYNGVREQ